MSTVAVPANSPKTESRLRSDSLADSVAILMLLTLIQPVVGFVRGLLFCRWLDPAELGTWDIALGFLTFAAPLVVLGIPGSFGRYVEYYRQRGSARRFLLAATLATISLTGLFALAMSAFSGRFSDWIFGSADQVRFVWLLALALGPLVAFGFVTELLNAFRLYRVVSVLQLLRSASFLGLGALLLFAWRMSAASIVWAYAISSLAVVLLGAIWLVQAWGDCRSQEPASYASLARKVAPFALWMWTANNLCNLFQIVDRYLIVHASGLPQLAALELVGNYHSARVVPLLIGVFANMLSSILLPHFSHAWEAGRASDVSTQLSLALKLFSFAITVGSAIFLVSAPLLFRYAFEGKYAAGQAVLPWTLLSQIWYGMACIGQTYLWCREQARLGSVTLLLGMIVNIALNLFLLPRFELWGAVWASAAAMFVVVVSVYCFNAWLGKKNDLGVWLAAAFPAALVLGPWGALAITAILAALAWRTNWILSPDERDRLGGVAAQYGNRLRAILAPKRVAN